MRLWLWIAVTSMPCWSSVRATALTSLSIKTKSPVIAALPSAVGWKFMTVVTPMAGSNCTPISVITSARGTVTWNTPPSSALPDLLGVEPRPRGRGGRRAAPATERRAAGGQCLAERRREFDRLAVARVVHVHHVRRHVVQMVVDGGDLEPPSEQAGHHGRHLLIEEHEVAHHHRLIPHRLECGVRSERESGLDRHTLHGDGEIGTWHPDTKDTAWLRLSRLAQGRLHRLPVGLRRQRQFWRADDHRHSEYQERVLQCLSHQAPPVTPQS